MKIKTDLHVHTIASTHAYSTVLEIASFAKKKNISHVAITDHGPNVVDGAHYWHFWNMNILPEKIYGVRILRGIEFNILDENGTIDTEIPEFLFPLFDWTIASIHTEAFKIKNKNITKHDAVTNAYLNIIDNKFIDCLGHSGNGNYPYDYEKVIKYAAQKNKIIEINNNSFLIREGTKENCKKIAILCKKYGTRIAVNSDAHFATLVCKNDIAIKMLEEIKFPEELIINLNKKSVEQYLKERKIRIEN
ncbi:MAG: phosphatase [Oscillospiraceae bacterium]